MANFDFDNKAWEDTSKTSFFKAREVFDEPAPPCPSFSKSSSQLRSFEEEVLELFGADELKNSYVLNESIMDFPEPGHLYRSHVVPNPEPLMSVQGESQSEGFSLRERDHVIAAPEHQKEDGVKILTHFTESGDYEITKKTSAGSEEVNLPSADLQALEMASGDSPKSRQMVTCRKNQQWRKIMGSGERTRGGKRVLALRADVMNKNFFRAIRRECKAMFDTFIYNHGFTNSRSKRIFRANLRRFSDNLLEDTTEQLTLSPDFKVEDFRVYIGILLNICVMKRLSAEESDKVK